LHLWQSAGNGRCAPPSLRQNSCDPSLLCLLDFSRGYASGANRRIVDVAHGPHSYDHLDTASQLGSCKEGSAGSLGDRGRPNTIRPVTLSERINKVGVAPVVPSPAESLLEFFQIPQDPLVVEVNAPTEQ